MRTPNSPRHRDNLRAPWKKGESGNPRGRPVDLGGGAALRIFLKAAEKQAAAKP